MNNSPAILHQLQKNFELLFWVSALVILFFMDTGGSTQSLCLFKWINSSYCPGCGLGHSIQSALHLQWIISFKQHPMGIAATLILLNRIKQLLFKLKTAQ